MNEFPKDDAWKQEEDRLRSLRIGKIEQLSDKPFVPTPEDLKQMMEKVAVRETDETMRHETAVGKEVLEQLNHGLNSLIQHAEAEDMSYVISTAYDLQRLMYPFLR